MWLLHCTLRSWWPGCGAISIKAHTELHHSKYRAHRRKQTNSGSLTIFKLFFWMVDSVVCIVREWMLYLVCGLGCGSNVTTPKTYTPDWMGKCECDDDASCVVNLKLNFVFFFSLTQNASKSLARRHLYANKFRTFGFDFRRKELYDILLYLFIQ